MVMIITMIRMYNYVNNNNNNMLLVFRNSCVDFKYKIVLRCTQSLLVNHYCSSVFL
jgi:hypothetical protein